MSEPNSTPESSSTPPSIATFGNRSSGDSTLPSVDEGGAQAAPVVESSGRSPTKHQREPENVVEIQFGAVRKKKSRSLTPRGKRVLDFDQEAEQKKEEEAAVVDRQQASSRAESPKKSPRSSAQPKSAATSRARSRGPSGPDQYLIGSDPNTPRTPPSNTKKGKARSSSQVVDDCLQAEDDSPTKRQVTAEGRLRSVSSSGLSSSFIKVPEGGVGPFPALEDEPVSRLRDEMAELRAELRQKDAELHKHRGEVLRQF